MPTEPTYNTGDAIDTALVRQNYGGPVGLTAESAVMGLCDEIDRLRLDLRSEQMERADAEREADRLRAEVYTATVANRITENHNHFDCAAEMTKLRIERDVLLADPAPVGLTEDERKHLDSTEFPHCPTCTAIIDRLSAAPVDDREREALDKIEAWASMAANDSRLLASDPIHRDLAAELRGIAKAACDALSVPVSPSVDPEEKP